jgi:DNA-directed RNA polymerase subunit RPC12/RpoP
MPGLQETSCPICGAKIFDLNLSNNEGVLCYNCYRNLATKEKPMAAQEG